jgi:hypothetical protein
MLRSAILVAKHKILTTPAVIVITLDELSQVCAIEMRVNNKAFANRIPHPRASIEKYAKKNDSNVSGVLLEALDTFLRNHK